MTNEYGFRFKIAGEGFIVQKSKAGVDVVDAYNQAVAARKEIKAALSAIPVEFSISEPEAASRRGTTLFDKPEQQPEASL